MTNQTTIRVASINDAKIICEFIHKLAEFENFKDLCSIDVELLKQLMQEQNGVNALIAERNGKVVGVLTYYFFKIATFSGKRVLYIEDVFINENMRGLGIGSMLFSKIKEIAITSKCIRLEWKCLDWNTPAQKFYNKIGAATSSEWLTYTINLNEEVT